LPSPYVRIPSACSCAEAQLAFWRWRGLLPLTGSTHGVQHVFDWSNEVQQAGCTGVHLLGLVKGGGTSLHSYTHSYHSNRSHKAAGWTSVCRVWQHAEESYGFARCPVVEWSSEGSAVVKPRWSAMT
jgi:hypothetical protein